MTKAVYYVRVDFPHNGWEVFYFDFLEEVGSFIEGILAVVPKVKYETGFFSQE